MYPAINILLALVWSGLLGGINLENIASGFLVSYLVLYFVTRGLRGHER